MIAPENPFCCRNDQRVLTAIAPAMTGADGDERFEFGLNVLIAGLEAASAADKAGRQQG